MLARLLAALLLLALVTVPAHAEHGAPHPTPNEVADAMDPCLEGRYGPQHRSIVLHGDSQAAILFVGSTFILYRGDRRPWPPRQEMIVANGLRGHRDVTLEYDYHGPVEDASRHAAWLAAIDCFDQVYPPS
jgi:hypothetical protein